MIRLATDKDKDLLNKIYSDDSVWPWIADDLVDAKFRHVLGTALLGIIKRDSSVVLTDGQYVAFWYKPMNSIMMEVHTATLPGGRGRYAVDHGKESVEWIFNYTQFTKIISFVPEDNRQALLFSYNCGFKKEGFTELSYLKDGQLIGQNIVGRAKICQ